MESIQIAFRRLAAVHEVGNREPPVVENQTNSVPSETRGHLCQVTGPGTNRCGRDLWRQYQCKECARGDDRSSPGNRERPISAPRAKVLGDREPGPIGRGACLSDRNGAGMGQFGRAKGAGLSSVLGFFRQLSPKLSHFHQ
jgi:hypothetical protein